MNLFLNLLTLAFYCTQIVDCRKVRAIPDDEIYPYTIDKKVTAATEAFSIEHLIFELIDDDTVRLGGYVECVRSLDPKLLLQTSVRTQYLYQSTWLEGPLQLIIPDSCAEAVNPSCMFYNISKLWTKCPPQKGDKWYLEDQIIDIKLNLPPSLPLGSWKFYFLFNQGLFGATNKFGAMAQVELIETV